MKLSVSSNDLLSAVSKVISVTPTRSTLPILGNLYFNLHGNELTIIGTDLEVYVEVKLTVNGQSNGQAALPAKRLESLLQNLQGKDISIELQTGYKLVIKAKGGRWTITGEDPADFPMPTEQEGKQVIRIDYNILTDYLPKAIHAASTDELRRSMNGVFFEIKRGEFRMVSTDGHRLVKIVIKEFPYEGDKLFMLVPIKTCTLINKLLRGSQDNAEREGGDVEISFSNEFIKCNYSNLTIHSRLIDDSFPNYESVIPTDNEKILKVERNELIACLKRSIIMSDQITSRISLNIKGNELKVKSSNTEFGTDSDESMSCNFTEDEEFEISFNGKYLLEAMQQIDSQELIFDFNTPLKAAIIRPSVQDENEDIMMLVMPVRNL
ncbi:MAG: DNA polymerase III subunit beta [Ignavibacteria bacterium]|nr:DNA polymerase III subunit beta [Ignavibacteria bacterium]